MHSYAGTHSRFPQTKTERKREHRKLEMAKHIKEKHNGRFQQTKKSANTDGHVRKADGELCEFSLLFFLKHVRVAAMCVSSPLNNLCANMPLPGSSFGVDSPSHSPSPFPPRLHLCTFSVSSAPSLHLHFFCSISPLLHCFQSAKYCANMKTTSCGEVNRASLLRDGFRGTLSGDREAQHMPRNLFSQEVFLGVMPCRWKQADCVLNPVREEPCEVPLKFQVLDSSCGTW